MSTLKVNKIENTATTDGGIEVDNTGHVKIDGQQLPTAGPLSNRNVIINGAMTVNQRGAAVTGDNKFPVDRWKVTKNSHGAYNGTQDSDCPSGFAKSIQIACTTAKASLDANSSFVLYQRIEGFNVQEFAKGTANAKAFSVSFWFKTNKTGTYIVRLLDAANNRSVSHAINVTASGTWVYYSHAFPADTTGTLPFSNANALEFQLWLCAGSDYTSSPLQTTWGASNSAANGATGQVNFFDSTSNRAFLTGVQLEVGDMATPFEHRSYADELFKCYRYFYDSLNPASADEGYIMGHMWGTGGNAASVYGTVTFPVQMRREPDLVTTSVVGGFRNYCENSAAFLAPASSPGYVSAQQAGSKHFVIGVHNWNTQPDGTGSAKYWTPGFGSWLEKYDDDQIVQFDAEL